MNIEISVDDTAAALAGDAPPLLLDVREHDEVARCRIDGAVHIPMDAVPGRIDDLPRDRTVIAYCHHGRRSLNVAAYLRNRGFAAVASLRGGIDAWSRAIDPAVPRY